ncbi:MAG: dTDP-4-dehydrorhamnose 3,5-epimerase [Gemmatimonadales bacterium]|nr:dTDP-4-dehydrorhamnose 3,5-epimerase [Gemmatimonadales bacterium]
MKVTATAIPDVLVIEPVVRRDERGFLVETWHGARYRDAGVALPFVQDNHSRSVGGTLRGLHYQIESAQGKLVRVAAGEVFDVAVDLRRSSPTFGRWVGVTLSGQSHHQLWIPPGFAHGFYVLSPTADLIYKCTALYAPAHDRAIRWDDPDVGISWPLDPTRPPILSARDATAPPFAGAATYD